MNKHLKLALTYLKKIFTQIYLFHKELKPFKKYSLFALYIALLVAIFFATRTKVTAPEKQKEYTRKVEVSRVSDLSSKGSRFPFLGTVSSVSEAVIRSESSGKLVVVQKKLGDKVDAGEIIATFENSSERAALLQAEGVYDAAKAGNLIAVLSGNNSGDSLEESKNTSINTLGSSLSSLEDAVRVKTDAAFVDPRTEEVKLLLSVPDANLVYSLEDQRMRIEKILGERAIRNKKVTKNSDLINELTTAEKEAQAIKAYLDDLAKAYALTLPNNSFTESLISANKNLVSAARSEVSGAISSLGGSRTSLQNSLTAKNIADKTSGNGPAVTSSEASVKQALGAYNSALSRYEKTIIRSPLSGTLNSLSIKTGDFITAFTQIGVVSNNNALEIKAYVGEDDAKRIVVGLPATVKREGKEVSAIITSVAEAIDPLTKKIEVKLAISDATHNLVNGESVTITITEEPKKSDITKNTGKILIPLSALKMTPDGALIFTVENGKAKSQKVIEGAIFGENIEIKSGVTEDTALIVDARGLKDGLEVLVK